MPGTDGVGAVEQRQGGGTRRQAITEELRDQLAQAAREAGVNAEIFSGGQNESGPNRVGSHRHDHGRSTDLRLYTLDQAGRRRYLDMRDAAERARMADFIRGTVRHGATGVGAAMDYMGPNGTHIAGGSPLARGARGRAANAPDWVGRAHEQGLADRAAGFNRERPPPDLPNWPLRGRINRRDYDGGQRFAEALRIRQAEEDKRREGMRLGPRAQNALQAGTMGGHGITANGRVNINVQTRDPGTQVRTSASGSLFREIVQSRGRQMRKAD